MPPSGGFLWGIEMTNIDNLIDDVIVREGGYVDHPADRGGPTNMGITEVVARQNGYVGDMRALSRLEAISIYKKLYWARPRFVDLAQLAPRIAAELFDTGINMGVGTATGFLQRALNALNRTGADYTDIAVDRQIGAATLKAVAAFLQKRGASGEAVLLKAIEALQGAHYINLAEKQPSQEAFLYGWLANRIGN
jgi:lysozyme family protein